MGCVMAEYNYSDINDAKRRVQEMKNRAREKTTDERNSDIASLISRIRSPKDKAFFISVLYILSSEATDEELILSLLSVLL